MSRLDAPSLRRSEDAFVDELFCGAVALGAPMIAARFPRAFLDANRAPAEIDGAMFEGDLPVAGRCAEPAGDGRPWRHSAHRARRRGDLSRQA